MIVKRKEVREAINKALKEGKAVIVKRKGGMKIIPKSPNVVVIEIEEDEKG